MAKKKAKAKAKRGKLPELVSMLACDHASRDPNTEKFTLYGIFENLASTEYPATFNPFSVYMKIKGGDGQHGLKLLILDPSGKKHDATAGPFDVTLEPQGTIEIVAYIKNFSLSRPGAYRFALASNNKRIGKPLEITAIKISKKRSKKRSKK